MQVFDTPVAMREFSAEQRASGRSIAIVPTMGALHAGHVALIDEARRRADVVVVTVFVNPLQFNRRDDFEAYPRLLDDDLADCEAAGADAVYAPSSAAMYPDGFETHVEPGALAEVLEGAGRPGHFRGVTTVVTKLFNAVRPDIAVFGRKDFQQLAVVRRMADDLDMGIDVVGVPTVREPDGLALSSRNRRLDDAQRAAALVVPRALDAVVAACASGVASTAELRRAAEAVILTEPLARLEYIDIVDPDSMRSIGDVRGAAVVLIAAWFGDVRLIDNVTLHDVPPDDVLQQ